jgi:hypothetical protein
VPPWPNWSARAPTCLCCCRCGPTRLHYRRYHVSSGEGSAGWHKIAEAFGLANPYRVVGWDEIERERARVALARPGDEERLLFGLRTCYRFMKVARAVFDNARLLAEGVPPPKFPVWLPVCLARPGDRSIHQQMMDDE